MSSDRGELAIVLHAHMPYVEGFGTWPFGEEWLFEAIATAYLPLIGLCERLAEAGSGGALTLNVSPVLADQLVLPEVHDRCLAFIREVRSETHRIDIEGLESAGDRAAAEALRRSALEYERAGDRYEQLGGDLVGALRAVADAGVVELWTSAATHPVLPLLATEAGVRLQVATGIDSHRERFGSWSGGFWLPECAYRPGLEESLAEAGVRAFCVYQPNDGSPVALEPVATASGPVAVPIDWDTIELVWDKNGYPADPVYRDYHAPTLNGMRPYANGGGGYVADAAFARAREHADDFLRRAGERLDAHRAVTGRPGLLVCALDAELLGHWWYEGPVWLAAVLARARDEGIALATLPAALARHEPRDGALVEATWGEGKDLTTWDSPAVADMLWSARRFEIELVAAAHAAPSELPEFAPKRIPASFERAARELLAVQSSDWAFMETRQLAADYPRRRARRHCEELERALAGDVPIDPALRGLAPGLRLASLVEPPSAWGRTPLDPV